VSVVDAGNQSQKFALVFAHIGCERHAGNRILQDRIPVLAEDLSIRIPVLDDVPEAVEREQLKASVG